jgi:magnesium transporter
MKKRAKALDLVKSMHVVGRLVHRSSKKPGSAPGTIVHTGGKQVDEVHISVMDYNATDLQERVLERIEDSFPLRDQPTVSWINVIGLHDVDLIGKMGAHFGLHPLIQEDIASVHQRPKVEAYDDYLYLVLHMLSFDTERQRVQSEQISLILGKGFVFSFQERVGDVFDLVRERLRATVGRIRARGADYLAYALTDAVVDGYYGILEKVGDQVEVLDKTIMQGPREDTLHHIHELKQEMLVIRRAVWPVRELMAQLLRDEHPLVSVETKVYLRDVYDHSIQVLDMVETLRDLSSGLTDLYLSSVAHRQNEIMKVLTIMASIFIPLTFLAGVYGMNFEHMPELAIPWAYPAVLGVMLAAALGMAWFFKRKGWW